MGTRTVGRRFRAVWEVGGREVLVVPQRPSTRGTFGSVDAARKALERRARRVDMDTRGLVKDAASGALVLTIAM